jgi:hypothetical protein
VLLLALAGTPGPCGPYAYRTYCVRKGPDSALQDIEQPVEQGGVPGEHRYTGARTARHRPGVPLHIPTVFTSAPSRSSRLAGAALLTALLVAGCGSASQSGESGKAGASDSPEGKASSRTDTGASKKPAKSPSTSAPAPPAASDGKRYSACADGTCEVALPRPVEFAVDGGTFTVKKVKPEKSLDFEVTLATGAGGSGTLKGTCGPVFRFNETGGGSSSTCAAADGTPTSPAP